MNSTRIVAVGMLALAQSFARPSRADGPATDAPAAFAAPSEEYAAAKHAGFAAARAKVAEGAKGQGVPMLAQRAEDTVGPAFASRFLRCAADHPGTPESLPGPNLALER